MQTLLLYCFTTNFAAQTMGFCEDKLEADQSLAADTRRSSDLGLLGFTRLSSSPAKPEPWLQLPMNGGKLWICAPVISSCLPWLAA